MKRRPPLIVPLGLVVRALDRGAVAVLSPSAFVPPGLAVQSAAGCYTVAAANYRALQAPAEGIGSTP